MPATVDRMSVGGSMIGKILGVSPWGTAREAYVELIAGRSLAEQNAAMRRGTVMEPIIADEYAVETGRTLRTEGKVYHPTVPYAHAQPDRIIVGADGRDSGVLEIKCMGQRSMQSTKLSGIAPSYYAQLQHYLWVTDLGWGSFACFNADDWDLHWFDVERDEEYIERIAETLERFWTDYVEPRRPPGTANIARIEAARPRVGAVAEDRTDDRQFAHAVDALRLAKEQFALAERVKKDAEQRVKDLMGDTEVVTCRGATITYKERTSRSFKVDRLQAAHPELDLSEFYEQTVSRYFTPKFT